MKGITQRGNWSWLCRPKPSSIKNGVLAGVLAVATLLLFGYDAQAVRKVTPKLSTTPNPASGALGVLLNDSATLRGGNSPTGTITFKLFDPSDPTCSGTPRFTQTVTVNGNGTYTTTGGFVADKVGTWRWTASYSGDAKNKGVTSGCAAEQVTIDKAPPTISTTPSPASGTIGMTLNDSATLSGGFNPTGKITFRLYDPDQVSCTGTPRFTQTVTVNGNGIYTTTGGLVADKVGTWRWTASYSGDANNNGVSSGCNAEQVTTTKASPTINTTPNPTTGAMGVTLNDSATVSGGFNPTGNVTFKLFDVGDTDCSGTPVYTQTVALSGGSASTSPGFTSNKVGVYRWTATYNGDANNNSVSSGCQAEQVTVTKPLPALRTEIHKGTDHSTDIQGTTVPEGTVVHDKAIVTGSAGTPTGTVDFKRFSTQDCTGSSTDQNNVPLSGGEAESSSFTTVGGFLSYRVHYDGDANYSPADGPCEWLRVQATPGIITQIVDISGNPVPMPDIQLSATPRRDSVTMTGIGAFGPPTGSVTFEVFKCTDNTCSALTGFALFSETVALSPVPSTNKSTAMTSGSFTPPGPGAYAWVATYSGDANYLPASEEGFSEVMILQPPLCPGAKVEGVIASSSPRYVTYKPKDNKTPATAIIKVLVTNNTNASIKVLNITPQADEPFTIAAVNPKLPRTIGRCKSQRFKVTTRRAAGLPQVTAARPYFDVLIESGGSQSHLTTASVPQPKPLRLMGVQMHLRAGQIHLQTEGTGIDSLQLQLFDLRGRKLIDHTSESRELTLSAEAATGQRLANGVYLYVVTVRGFDGSIIHSQVRKLVILR